MDSITRRKLLGFAATLGTTFAMFALYAVQGVILARILGPERRGQFAAAVLFPQALLYMGMLGAPELIAGYAARGMANAPLRRSAALYGLVAGAFSVVACIILSWWTIRDGMRFVFPLAALCALAVPLQQTRLAVQAVDHGQRAIARYNWGRLIGAASFPAALVIGYLAGLRDVTSMCWLFLASPLIPLLTIGWGMDGPWIGPRAVPLSQSLRDAKGLIAAYFSAELLERLDMVLMLVLVANDRLLGYYAPAIPIVSTMSIVPHSVGLYVFNRGARDREQLTRPDLLRLLSLVFAVQVACGAALAAVLPWAVYFLYGDEFQPTVHFAWALIPAGVFRGLLYVCDNYMRAVQRPGAGVRARLVAIPVLIGLSAAALPRWGALAIPIAVSIAMGTCFVAIFFSIVQATGSRESKIGTGSVNAGS